MNIDFVIKFRDCFPYILVIGLFPILGDFDFKEEWIYFYF